MKKYDLHIHSEYSDGLNSIEDIIVSAIEKGFDIVGISDHSYTEFDESYCIKKEDVQNYYNEIERLKNKYSDKIKVYSGIEQDFYSDESDVQFDYKIGSVHYLKVNGCYLPVDESKEILLSDVDKHFGSDIYAYLECYFETVSKVIDKTNADIIGHIDLINKFNENDCLFDTKNIRYITAFKNACNKLIKTGRYFEINTGAISRGYRSSPYPSNEIYNYLKDNGAKFILSSDSHSIDTIGYLFDKYKNCI